MDALYHQFGRFKRHFEGLQSLKHPVNKVPLVQSGFVAFHFGREVFMAQSTTELVSGVTDRIYI